MPSGPTELSPAAARRLRLRTQGLTLPDGGAGTPDLSPADVVRRMVALQGQDLPAVLRAIAVRSRQGTTLDDVRAAFDAGELVRGWTQRGTALRDHAGRPRRARLAHGRADAADGPADPRDRGPGRRRGGPRRDGRPRSAQVRHPPAAASRAPRWSSLWQQAGVPIEGQRGYHLIATLAVQGVLHWGPFAGAQQLMVETPGAGLGDVPAEEPDAALRRIARSYFASRGPATVEDLAWWLGLPKVPVRTAVAELRAEQPDAVVEVVVDGKVMLVGQTAGGPARPPHTDLAEPSGVLLVPGFDEIVLGYQDRELVADAEAMRTVVPFVNGIFRPAVLLDGRVVGTWRRAPKSGEAPFELVPGIQAEARAAVDAAVAAWHLG